MVEDRFSPDHRAQHPGAGVADADATRRERPAEVRGAWTSARASPLIGSENLGTWAAGDRADAGAGEASIEVRFTYDANGLLEADVRDVLGGHTASTLIRNTATEMSEAQMTEALKQLRALEAASA